MTDQLRHYINHWNLARDGEPFKSYSGLLQPVLYNGVACMLKITRREKDKAGNALMAWWNGAGAAPVLRHDENALLMERAAGGRSLSEMAKNGYDDETSRIICTVAGQLHAHLGPYPQFLAPLEVRFKALSSAAKQQGGIFKNCNEVAGRLLAKPEDIVVLHGDIHHDNILDFGQKGWLAIDPKGLLGERGFDYANMFCNPDHATATKPDRLMRQVRIVSAAAEIEPIRLLQWIAAWAGLSAAWAIEDGEDPATAMSIAELAVTNLNIM
ncbi:MAG: hypothetical protein JST19_05185 [Bacteroidetes bacterium]|nr:hypothetical protein [Bacteroidota bacterium]